MNELTQSDLEAQAPIQLKPGTPGYLNNYLQSFMRRKSMPRGITGSLREKLQYERKRNECEAGKRTYRWFCKEYLPTMENINKQPLSDDVIEWMNNFLIWLIQEDKYRHKPSDAVLQVSKFANRIFTDYYTSKGMPIILRNPTAIHTWYCMLLLGADGQVFPLSGEAVAKALTELFGKKVHSPTVYRIIDSIRLSGYVTQIQRGEAQGRCGTYKLRDDLHKSWEKLGSTPHDGNSPITADEIRKMFPWIFQTAD